MANALSMVRIALIPLFLYLVLGEPVPGSTAWALGVLLVSGLTDVADGWVARRRGEVSVTGTLLDPLADKLTLTAALVALAWRGWIPLWAAGLLAVKEVVQMLGAAWLARRRRAVTARWPGKAATVLLYAGAAAVLWGWRQGIVILLAGVFLSVTAGIYYAVEALRGRGAVPPGRA